MTTVEDHAGAEARSVQGEHGLVCHVHGGSVERLENDLGHLPPLNTKKIIHLIRVADQYHFKRIGIKHGQKALDPDPASVWLSMPSFHERN